VVSRATDVTGLVQPTVEEIANKENLPRRQFAVGAEGDGLVNLTAKKIRRLASGAGSSVEKVVMMDGHESDS
jgi:hypothetical protein